MNLAKWSSTGLPDSRDIDVQMRQLIRKTFHRKCGRESNFPELVRVLWRLIGKIGYRLYTIHPSNDGLASREVYNSTHEFTLEGRRRSNRDTDRY
jgi:hypothetical protein